MTDSAWGVGAKATVTERNALRLPLKTVYFDQIKAGTKKEEYRLRTPYWRARIEGKSFRKIILTRGYRPLLGQLERPWRGYEVKTITHQNFGPDPVEVYAIKVN